MITKKEKIEITKGLIEKDLGYRKISKKAHLSFGDIAKLKKEAEGISTEEKYTQAYRMFDAKKRTISKLPLSLDLLISKLWNSGKGI